jgi:hypothetical protein
MGDMTTILAQFWPLIAGAVGALIAALGVYAKGRSDERHKADVKRLNETIETRKRIDAENYIDPDVDAARERLRERGKR